MPNDEKKTSQKQSAGKIVLWVAIIGLIGTLGAALIANWDKMYPPPVSIKKSVQEELVNEKPVVNHKLEVEKLTSQWLSAWLNGDVENVIALSSEPFYFDNEVLLTKQQIRPAYLALYNNNKENWRQIKIDAIKIQTARELKEQGIDLNRDRIFPSLNLSLDDYAITITTTSMGHTEGALIMARMQDGNYKIVGMWD